MENELYYIISGGILSAGMLGYGFYKFIKKEAPEFKKQCGELEKLLTSIPEEERQKTIKAIKIINSSPTFEQEGFMKIVKKYSTN